MRVASILPFESRLPPIAVCDSCLAPVSNEKELSKSEKQQGGSDGTRPVVKAELEGHLPGLLLKPLSPVKYLELICTSLQSRTSLLTRLFLAGAELKPWSLAGRAEDTVQLGAQQDKTARLQNKQSSNFCNQTGDPFL